MNPSRQGRWRAFAVLALALLLSACGVLSGSDPRGQILVVDGSGRPLKGAVILPDPETAGGLPKYTDEELKDRSTNAQGMLLVYLDDFYWSGDGCYHIHVHRSGYEDETMTVSKDLIPAVLKIDMRPRVLEAAPSR
jgi:hypothetical protein